MLLGFALTQHCNLRCPHCIRDDVATVQSLEPELVLRVTDEARDLFGDVVVSFTGGEPTIHPRWDDIVAGLVGRGVPYRFVTNGWHMRRLMPALDRWPPQAVRLSLSGATEATHDAERGRGSFRRVLLAVAMLTSRGVPISLSLLIDRRDRHEIETGAELAESLGVNRLHYVLAQPVPASVARDSDLPPNEWPQVRDEVERIAREAGRLTAVQLDYGAPPPPGEPAELCDTMAWRRAYVDARGRLSLCCQLSEYGGNARDVVADLHETSLADAWVAYQRELIALRTMAAPAPGAGALPCMRCAGSLGKLDWLAKSGAGAWQAVAVAG